MKTDEIKQPTAPEPIAGHDKNTSFTSLAATERGQNALAREYTTIRVGRWQSLSFVPKVGADSLKT